MKKYLLVLLLGVISLVGYSQGEQIYYRIKFEAFADFDWPCNDGDGGYFYTKISETSSVEFKITDTEGLHTFNKGNVYDFTDTILYNVTAKGTASVSYEYKGEVVTESGTFDISDFETVYLKKLYSIGCNNELRIPLTTYIDDANCDGDQRLLKLVCMLKIMPHKRIMIGDKLCTGDPIALEALETQPDHDWYARINGVEWFSLDRDGASEEVYIDNIYSKAPKIEKIDDSVIPSTYYYVPVEFVPGDKIELLVDHGCPAFSFTENPRTTQREAYPSPDVPESVFTPNSPTCVGDLDGSISVGLINGISPTYFSYSLHEVIHYPVNPEECSNSIADSNVPLEIPANSGNWYCSNGVSGNYLFTDDDTQNVVELNALSSDGGITGIYEGDWLIYIKQDDEDAPCENYYVKQIIDPDQPALTDIDIPTYTYSTNEYNLPYQGASETVTFNYKNGTLTNDIIIDERAPVTGGENSGEVVGLTAGTYELKINDEKGCPFYIPEITDKLEGGKFTLTPPGPLTLGDTTKDPVSCHHENASYTGDGSVEIGVSGGLGPYKFVMDGTTTKYTYDSTYTDTAYTMSFKNLAYGYHEIRITPVSNPGNEEVKETIFIENPDPLELWIDTLKDPICPPVQDGEIVFHGIGGTPNYTYYLDGTERKNNIPGLQKDSINSLKINTGYTIRIKDTRGCITDSTFRMDEYANLLKIDALTAIPEVCLGGADGSLVLHAQGGHNEVYDSSDFVYYDKIYKEQMISGSEPSHVKYQNLYSDSTYTVTLLDNKGCTITKEVSITGYSSPLSLTKEPRVPPVCIGSNDGSILLQANGGHNEGNYDPTYFSFPGDFTTYKNEAFVDESGIMIKLDNLYSDSTYSIKFDDKEGCSIRDTVKVTGYSSPLFFTKEQRTPPSCIGGNDGTINLRGSGGHETSYDHTHFSLQGYNEAVLTTGATGVIISELYGDSTYTITIDDKSGCTNTDTLYLGEEPNPVQVLQLDSAEEKCYGYKDGWIKVSGTSGEKPVSGYNYYLTSEENFTINPTAPTDTSTVKTGDEAVFYKLPPGTHNIYISDQNDCLNENITAKRKAYKTGFHVDPQDLVQYTYELHNTSTIGAEDGYLQVTITGANNKYEYQLINKETLATLETGKVDPGTFKVETLKEGEYSLQFKDTCGCSNSALEWINYNFIIIDPADPLEMEIIRVNPPSCYGYSDGSIEVQGIKGWGYYTYGINSVYNGNTDGIITGLASGSYNICVKDKEGAEYCETVYINQPGTLHPLVQEITGVQCHNGNDGKLTLGATGGTKPYYFSPDNLTWQEDSTLTGYSKGNYTVYIKDAHDCKASTTAEFDHPGLFTITSTITSTICGEANGTIQATTSGGTPPYNYTWYKVDTQGEHQIAAQTATASNLPGGKYKLYIRDAHDCDTSREFIVNNSDGPGLTINQVDRVTCSGMADGAISYTVEQGLPPYHVELQSGQEIVKTAGHQTPGSYTFTGLAQGNYRIMVRDANPCIQSSEELQLNVPNPIVIIIDTLKHPVCFGESSGQIIVQPEGGNGSYTYQWSTGESTNSIHNLKSGTYTITTTDLKGCFTQETYELTDPEKITVEIGEDQTICEGQAYPISIEGYATYNWKLNGQDISTSPEIEAWIAGEYVLQVTDTKGCLAEDTFQLTLSKELLDAEILMASEVYENDTVVAIDISWPEPERVEWAFSSGIIEINSEKYIEEIAFTGPGIYTVSLTTYKAMCVDSASQQIVVLADTNNTEKSLLGANPLIKTFKVYPNPNNGQFSVQVELDNTSDIILDLYSIQQNRLVFRQNGSGQSNYNIEYGFTNLQQGMYMVILYVESKKRTERILIF